MNILHFLAILRKFELISEKNSIYISIEKIFISIIKLKQIAINAPCIMICRL